MIDYNALAKKNQDYVIEMRRKFHRHPELSGKEFFTSSTICEELDKMKIPYTKLPDLNIIAVVDSGKAGKKVALRADFDALPVQELTDVPFKSEVDGVMHACGHDAHAATLLGVAKGLLEIKDQFSGKVLLCFQMGEEMLLGGKSIAKYLKEIGGVDFAFAVHIFAMEDTGVILLPAGRFAAGVMGFTITVKGRGGHGSMPHAAIDPIKPACDMLLKISALPVNKLDSLDPVVVSPCTIHSGTAANIIPDTAEFTGTIRYFNKNITEDIQNLLEKTCKGIALSYGVDVDINYMYEPMLPVINDRECAQIGQNIAKDMGLTLKTDFVLMGSDDMAYILDAFPGFYAGLGCANDAKGIRSAQHNCLFDVDEDSMEIANEFLLRNAIEFLGK
ncbi:MAG: amidohydrolase [Oscillospiraceae bacterium]